MDSFEKVTRDVISAIDKLEYTDQKDKEYQTQVMLTLYQMFRNEETYKDALQCLQINESNKKKEKALVLGNKIGL